MSDGILELVLLQTYLDEHEQDLSEELKGLIRNVLALADVMDQCNTYLFKLNLALEQDAAMLRALHAGGVDNWDGYDDAMDAMEGPVTRCPAVRDGGWACALPTGHPGAHLWVRGGGGLDPNQPI